MEEVIKKIKQDYKKIYPSKLNLITRIKYIITCDMTYKKWKYIKYMRKSNSMNYNGNLINDLKKIYYDRKKNKLGMLFGYEIYSNSIGGGLCLYHNGSIIINNKEILGNNCSLHGENCIGNDGITDDNPIIGDNVEIGIGEKIIGNVRIANNCIIGAGSVVVDDVLEDNSVVVGVPGRIIKKDKIISNEVN